MRFNSAHFSLIALAAFYCVSVSTANGCSVDGFGSTGRSLLPAPAFKAVINSEGDRDRQEEAAVVGLWNITVTSDGAVILRGFEAYHSDHTEIVNEFHDPRTGNVCLGVWEQSGWQTFKLKHPAFWWDANGNWIGYRIIRQTVTLDEGGNSFSGPWSVDRLDVNGNFVSHVDGQIVGTRVTADN